VTVETLWSLSNAELARVLATGHPIDAAALTGSFRGVSLGLPAWVDRIAWKVFRKVFVRGSAGVEGYNVRLVQSPGLAPVSGRAAAQQVRGRDRTFGPFRVTALPAAAPFGCRAGVLLDYGAAHPVWHPLARLRDPLVAVVPGSTDLLLGASYLALGAGVRTPSFFTLEREPGE
jgi:hypothetical protein